MHTVDPLGPQQPWGQVVPPLSPHGALDVAVSLLCVPGGARPHMGHHHVPLEQELKAQL